MAIERIMPAILSPPRQDRLRLPHFLPLGIGVLGEVYELAEILGRLRTVAHRVGGARGAEERAVAVGRVLERGLVFLERRRGLADFQQQLGQHLAQRIEAVFPAPVLDSRVPAVPQPTPEPPRLVSRAFPRPAPSGKSQPPP